MKFSKKQCLAGKVITTTTLGDPRKQQVLFGQDSALKNHPESMNTGG